MVSILPASSSCRRKLNVGLPDDLDPDELFFRWTLATASFARAMTSSNLCDRVRVGAGSRLVVGCRLAEEARIPGDVPLDAATSTCDPRMPFCNARNSILISS